MKLNTIYTLIVMALLTMSSCKQDAKSGTESSEMPAAVTETEEVNIKGKEVTYETDSTSMRGYMAWNESSTGKVPGIIVVHEWWGHNEYSRKRADMLAELGYVAFAIDMYGDGKQADHPEKAMEFTSMVMQNMDEAKARFNAALNLLKNDERVDPDKIAAIGYCFGGSVALTMANSGADLDAVAAFHSGINLPVGPSKELKARVLVCNGANDPFIPEEDVSKFRAAMDSVGADYKYIAYDAMHSFTSKAADSLGAKFEMPLAYDAEADQKSWEELQQFLKETFK